MDLTHITHMIQLLLVVTLEWDVNEPPVLLSACSGPSAIGSISKESN